MKGLYVALPAFLRASLGVMFQYRAEAVLWVAWGVVYPTVAMVMWSAASKDAPGGDIRGLTPRDFAAYFLMTVLVNHVCAAWDVFELPHFIRQGSMSPKLLRPVLPIWESIADNLSYKILSVSVLLPIWLIIAWVARPAFASDRWSLLLGTLALIQAGILNYIWGYTLALGAFWVTRMEAVGQAWFGLSMFLGGRLAPIALLPGPLQWAAAFLPFQWVIWFPSVCLIGWQRPEEMAWGLLWQFLWMVGGIVLYRLVWRAAVRQYSAVGA